MSDLRGLDVKSNANRDPITGEAGSHPIGTGLGAVAGGMAAGALAGTVVGPIGTAIGAAAGAVAGAFAGREVAELIDPTVEDAYWRETYTSRPYVKSGETYNDFGPAYRYGVDAYPKYEGRSFEDAEADLRRDWHGARGESRLDWERAKAATRDSWERVSDAVERAVPGDSDRDGK